MFIAAAPENLELGVQVLHLARSGKQGVKLPVTELSDVGERLRLVVFRRELDDKTDVWVAIAEAAALPA